jgi:uncharacterized membrane protein YgdD (TMEM256/DUF423 family)
MHKKFLQIAAILTAITIAMGAFGAHKLKTMVSEAAVNTFETGVRYQFYHAFGLFIVGILYKEYSNKFLRLAGWLFIGGVLLFSGSLYILTYKAVTVSTGFKWAGPITPLGGLLFIAGWLSLAIGIGTKRMSDV